MNIDSDRTAQSPAEFARVVANLEVNDPTAEATKTTWVTWLSEYGTPGYYGRKGSGYDARFAYNHMQNPEALLWLAAAGVDTQTLLVAREAVREKTSLSAQAAAVRKHVPWSVVAALLWPAR